MIVRFAAAAVLVGVCLSGSAGETERDVALALEAALGPRPAAVRRSVERSSNIVEGMIVRFLVGASVAEVRVLETLKGDTLTERTVLVDFSRQPFGLWPQRGERAVLMLVPQQADYFELAGYSNCVFPSDEEVRLAIGNLIEDVRASEQERLVAAQTETVDKAEVVEPAPEPVRVDGRFEELMASAETVLVGTLSNVSVRDGLVAGLLAVEYGLYGYAAYDRPVAISGSLGGELPSAGRYAAFLTGSAGGELFSPVSADALVNLGEDITVEARIMRAVDAVVDGRGLQRSGLTSVQALLSEWRQSWNRGDLARSMRCYSSRHPLRQVFDAGGPERDSLLAQMREFGGRMEASLVQVRRAGVFTEGGEVKAEAQVFVSVELSAQVERRGITMTLVREDGEWRILDEGL